MADRATTDCGTSAAAGLDFLAGGGEMGGRIRALDWAHTPIGAPEGWSPSMRMMVSLVLANRFPLLLWWGPRYIQIYNDSYLPVLGTKHPASLGQPAAECWPEIWHIIGSLIDTPFNGGPSTCMDDIDLELSRHGYVEEAHFTIAYSPVPDQSAPRGIGGVLANVYETTDKVIGERRVEALRALASRVAEAKTAEAACGTAAETLALYKRDVPFAMLYLLEPGTQRWILAGTAGVAADGPVTPASIELGGEREAHVLASTLREAVQSESLQVLGALAERWPFVPPGPWGEPPHTAVAVPISANVAHQLAGVLVAGVSPRRVLDAQYTSFFELVAGQIATVVTNLERGAVQAALHRRTSQFETLLNAAPLGIYLVDADFRIREANPIARSVFGDLADLVGRDFDQVIHLLWRKPYADEMVRLFRHTLETGESYVAPERTEQRLDRGALEHYEWRIDRIPLHDGRFGVVCYFRDISALLQSRAAVEQLAREREQLLGAERAARSEAESAMRAKDEFLATLSHELRTPLSSIVSWAGVLQRKYTGADEQLKRGLDVIVDNAMVQSQIIADLVDMSRIVAGKITLERKPVDLAELTALAVSAQRPAADRKGIALELVFEHEGAAVVLADATRLQQVLWNLLSNALKFTPAGGEVSVHLRANRAGELEIEVRDTGEGISPEVLPHVFDRFRQGDSSASRRHGGLGLGLAIVRQLIELQDGLVSASSEGPGRGASFVVRLPAWRGDVRSPLALDGTPKVAEVLEPQQLEGMHILAVEDQPNMLEFLRRLLEEQGAEVVTAASGAAALGLLRSMQIDMLVCDIGMPAMDGYQLLHAVRTELKLAPDVLPAIAVTAFARNEDRARALAAGFQAHVTKPYQVTQLVTVLRNLRQSADIH